MRSDDYASILGTIPIDILELVSSIKVGKVKDEFRKRAYQKEYDDIRAVSMLASVKYSNAIEDIISTDDRIRELALRGGRPLTHSEEQIAGYGEALYLIHRDPDDIRMDDRSLQLLHSTIRAGREGGEDRFQQGCQIRHEETLSVRLRACQKTCARCT